MSDSSLTMHYESPPERYGDTPAGVWDAMRLTPCGHCAGWHLPGLAHCPLIEAVEYHPNGQIARLAYRKP